MTDAGNTRDANASSSGQTWQSTQLSLLQLARAKDSDAWDRLVDLYGPLVRFWCTRAGLTGADAEDLAQEVFVAVFSGLGRFRRDRPGDSFRRWLRGVTRNKLLMHFRRQRGEPQAEGGSSAWEELQGAADPFTGTEDEETPEFRQVYHRALEHVRGEFEPATWLAFWLTVIEGRSPASLTEELHMTPASIRQAKSRVLRRVKQVVGDLPD
jgi:RNA polymerase sigma-70 factor (ECF subfamily)